jgi:hypothetical protein
MNSELLQGPFELDSFRVTESEPTLAPLGTEAPVAAPNADGRNDILLAGRACGESTV